MCNSNSTANCSVSNSDEINNVPGFSNSILISKSILGTVGVVSNTLVIVAFASNTTYRKKIPIMFMINQVRQISNYCFKMVEICEFCFVLNVKCETFSFRAQLILLVLYFCCSCSVYKISKMCITTVGLDKSNAEFGILRHFFGHLSLHPPLIYCH